MKRILLTLVLAAAFAVSSFSQVTITTRKAKVSDFTTRTTRMVLTGDAIFDGVFRQEVSSRWLISPFEFCTREEYENSKTSQEYYFLMPVDSRRKKESEPGLAVLTLLKGGPEEGDATVTSFEILSVPYASAEDPSGREFVLLPALLDAIQSYMKEAMITDTSILGVPGKTCNRLLKAGKMKIVFAQSDIAPAAKMPDNISDKNIVVMDEDDADELFAAGEPETLVSFVIAPTDPSSKGSVCYTMLVSADTHEIYYCGRHAVKDASKAGFLSDELKIITLTRK